MSGHSKWSQIKHKKEAADQKRGQLFSKLLNGIAIAARGNPNPEFNPRLRTAIQKAREANVPAHNIERAVKKSTEGKNLEEIIIEAYGPEKSALIIEGVTDNKNRALAQIKTILNEHGAKVAERGSVLWSFENKGGVWQPKFKQPISGAGKKALLGLIQKLEEHDDVQKVTSNCI